MILLSLQIPIKKQKQSFLTGTKKLKKIVIFLLGPKKTLSLLNGVTKEARSFLTGVKNVKILVTSFLLVSKKADPF